MNICLEPSVKSPNARLRKFKEQIIENKRLETVHKSGFNENFKINLGLPKLQEPMKEALEYLKSDEFVKVVTNQRQIYFHPQKNPKQVGIILYQGCMVDKRSYAPLARRLAKRGYKVILSDITLDNVSKNNARKIMDNSKNINKWFVGGHSFGGVMASETAHFNSDKVSGVILLSSFPMKNFAKKNINFLDIRATNDKILNSTYADISYKLTTPKDKHQKVTIEGGNHSNFGYYNLQKGDGTATISREQQQKTILKSILKFLESDKV